METKKHYKLYKSGKLWMTAMISAAVLGVASVAHADTTNQANATASTDTSVVTSGVSDSSNIEVEIPATQSIAPQANAQVEETAPAKTTADTVTTTGQVNNQEIARQPEVTPPAAKAEEPQNVTTFTQPQVNSTITVSNPANYPTDAAKLVGQNQYGEKYYIYQIVKLDKTTIKGQEARMILAVDPRNPQGTNYVYVTDRKYSQAYQSIVVPSGGYVDVSVNPNTGKPLSKPTQNDIYRISNTKPFKLNFEGKEITVSASLSIKSVGYGNGKGVSPVYGLGNQNNTSYSDKVDISPENKAPAIEYIYQDKNGNYVTSDKLPANVPVNGITGQQFTITNVDNYKQVVNGYFLTNQQGSLANAADGSYKGTISQFQIGQYYEKTLYNWDRSVSQTLIYKLIDPKGTMEISLIRPREKTETVTVPVNEYKVFSNGTLARNPFVPGANSVQLVYADLGKIIPVDENGNPIAGASQPIYNNDPSNPHKAGATQSPDLTALGWVLADQTQATINPESPGIDTKVQYVRVVVNTEEKKVTQTVKYQYADGVTNGRPALPGDKVQTATFIHTVITNPVTGQVLQDTWTPAQQFTAEASPAIDGFWADQKVVGGNDKVTQDTPSTTFVVLYAGPNETTEEKKVTQTVKYEYQDGITAGRPQLPQQNVQTLTFTATIQRNPETGEIISTTWSPAQNFTMVTTPELDGYYYSEAQAGSIDKVTHESGNTEYTIYYAPPTVTTQDKVISQTIHYQYADGVTEGRPALPKDDVQYIKFTETLGTNPFTGHVVSFGWTPSADKFSIVQTPTINGFYADLAQAGSEATVVHEDSDTYYVVNFAAPVSTVTETKRVTQTIKYQYADGQTAGRPTLPQTDIQSLAFDRTVVTNPWTHEIISDTWSPAQNFTVMQTPALEGYYYDQAQAGSDVAVSHESGNTEYIVNYAPAKVATTDKTVTQTIKYQYANGVNGDPALLPKDNVQSLTFTNTILTNPWTDEVISNTWSPAQQFNVINSPTINGYHYDQAQAGSNGQVTHESPDTTYVVEYLAPNTTSEIKTITQTIRYEYADGNTQGRPTLPKTDVQTLTFIRTIVRHPTTGEIISDTWTPAQNFSIVKTPALNGFYYDLAQAGSNAAVTHEGASTEYVVKYAPGKVTTENKTVSQTVRYEYLDGITEGRPALPQNNVQSVEFVRTVVTNPFTGEVISDTWSPAQQFTLVNTPKLDGYYSDQSQAGSTDKVTHESADTEYVVRYAPGKVTTENKTVSQTIRYEYLDGITEGRPALPQNNVQSIEFVRTIVTNPHTGEVISDTWSPAQKFTLVNTPKLDGYYYDLAQAGSTAMVTHESTDTEYVVKYAPPKVTTETEKVTQTIKYEYGDGKTEDRPKLPEDSVISVDFTHTVITNPFTGEVIEDKWSPDQTIDAVTSPVIEGFHPDKAVIPGSTISHDNKSTEYVVKYEKDAEPESPAPEQPTPEKPAQPTPEVPVTPAPETPETPEVSEQPDPGQTVEAETTVEAVKVSAPVEENAQPATENKKLPQTGGQTTNAIAGLGLIAGFLGLFGLGLGKRKREE